MKRKNSTTAAEVKTKAFQNGKAPKRNPEKMKLLFETTKLFVSSIALVRKSVLVPSAGTDGGGGGGGGESVDALSAASTTSTCAAGDRRRYRSSRKISTSKKMPMP